MKKLAFIFVIVLSWIPNTGFSQNAETDFNKFIEETQKSTSGIGEVTVAWWIPIEFWKITFQNDKSMTEAQINEVVNLLKPYVIFAVVDGKIGSFGGVTFNPVDSIRNSIQLWDKDGKPYKPLSSNQLSGDIQNLLSIFNPILKNLMGQLGENMHFFVFSDLNKNNNRIFDPLGEGVLQLTYSNKSFNWKTPLGSLLPLNICPIDNEKMNGAWKYCPFHGEKLIKNTSALNN